MARTSSPRDVLRQKLTGIGQAARLGKNESGSLLPDDVTELLAMVAEGDEAKAFVMAIANNRRTFSVVQAADDALVLASKWASAAA
jgi:hypothetical protein